ncbi:iron-sulfur protein [Carbonactinospora thermoautotrophica]|uniref:Iron-sulfur protein n=1 Tax=Carbonactinospora thermoautotrophica TaxID=1469144 RepID=A0A132MVT3_9ACTN|nr:hypothetical protein [Carbonactinospora thermoautotrophica]KWX01846.1 Uncharacterized protein LI90_2879 [Carbonactinospora thermoautotrophica]MCX9190980.1 iron-sulfur protein [Carbonactinospora thermoautotrophica]
MPVSTTPPLGETYARVAAACDFLQIQVGRPPDPESWTTGAQLTADAKRLVEFVDAKAARMEQEYGRPARRDVVASWAFHHYAWLACLLVAGPLLLDRRVPLLGPGDVAVPRRTGVLAGPVTVAVPGFACLPGDPAADHPQARVVADADALRRVARDTVAGHLAPVLAAFRPHVRRGPHALWGMVTDELAGTLWHLGQALGREEEAVAEATALLPGGTPPFVGGAGFRTVELRDRAYTRTRLTCCLYYTLCPEDVCSNCPRIAAAAG